MYVNIILNRIKAREILIILGLFLVITCSFLAQNSPDIKPPLKLWLIFSKVLISLVVADMSY